MVTGRYETHGSPEGEFQPGSGERVLRNHLEIIDPDEMDRVELDLLSDFQFRLYDEIEVDQRITSRDLVQWHRDWLGPVYPWAGRFRNVNISKEGFPFLLARKIDGEMARFEAEELARWTPCESMRDDRLVQGLAECHVELMLIHPFRDGNGRLGRILATVMALQAGHPPLDFTLMDVEQRRYIGAIHAGMDRDYRPMESIFREILFGKRKD